MFDGLLQSSEITLMDCCSLKRYEKLLIICDPSCIEIGSAFYKTAESRCQETVMVVVSPENRQGRAEFPDSVIEMLRKFNVAVIPLSSTLSHFQIKQVVSENKIRVASFPEITNDIFVRTMNADWRKVGINTRKIAGRLSIAKNIRVINGAGTDFTFQTNDSNIITDDGRLSSEGGFNVLPAGQVYLTPRESSFEGILIIDGYFSLTRGMLQQNLTFEVQGGLVCGVKNHPLAPELEKHFYKFKEAARCISSFGIGVLETAKISGNLNEDRVSMGAVHLTFGKGLSFGVNHGVLNPLEAIISRSTILIDGKPLIQEGVLAQ